MNATFRMTAKRRAAAARTAFALVVTLVAATTPGSAFAQYVYPSKGQSAAQQSKDEADCYSWAKSQTGFDPAATQTAAQPAPQQHGQRLGGAARGAAGGAAIGAIAGDAGKGAAIGAVTGTMAGGARKRQEARASNAQAQQQQSAVSQQQANYQQARTACLQGKGYSVK